jgi:hypothetical protein
VQAFALTYFAEYPPTARCATPADSNPSRPQSWAGPASEPADCPGSSPRWEFALVLVAMPTADSAPALRLSTASRLGLLETAKKILLVGEAVLLLYVELLA